MKSSIAQLVDGLSAWPNQFKKQRLASLGEGFKVVGRLEIDAGENVTIGKNFRATGPLYIYAHGGDLTLGDHVTVNRNCHLGASSGRISIGNDVMIGPNCVFRAADHGTQRGSLMRVQSKIGGVINVGSDVWFGANVVVTRDVTIGDGSVIGAGAVVTRDLPPHAIAVGVPARVIGTR